MSEHLKELLRMAHEQLDSQAAMIAELASKLQDAQGEKISAIAKERKRWARQDLVALEIRDLEQQVKSLQKLLGFSFQMNSPASEWVDVIYLSDVEAAIISLLHQSKALKEDN
jgi:hypothetical protein